VAAVIVREKRFLVIRRSCHVVAPLAYCFPGGAIEPGESEEEAIVREIREELDATIQPLRQVWQSVTPWGVSLAWWDCELRRDAPLTPNPAEVESVCWCTPDEMARLPGLLQSNREFLDALAEGRIELRLS
jgi:8-oxo-dGTP diphosphatase